MVQVEQQVQAVFQQLQEKVVLQVQVVHQVMLEQVEQVLYQVLQVHQDQMVYQVMQVD